MRNCSASISAFIQPAAASGFLVMKSWRIEVKLASTLFHSAEVGAYLALPRSTWRRACGSHIIAAFSLPAWKLLVITSIGITTISDGLKPPLAMIDSVMRLAQVPRWYAKGLPLSHCAACL